MIMDMWDVKKYVSHRGNSMRLFFVLVLTAIMALLSSTFLTIQPVAAAPGDATWSGQSIAYDGKTFTGPVEAAAGDSHNITPGSKLYVYVDPVPAGTPSTPQKAYVIYFAPGTSPPAEKTATYVTFDYSPPKTYSNPSTSNTITIIPTSTSPSTTTGGSSCVVDGIGWIVCPVTNFLAKSMDWLFSILTSFLEVKPIQTNQQTPIYRAWSVMQSFANVAFVIAFLVIIYSQVTGGMMTNYGIKKLLPRVIVAAILVNISYWICSVAVDVSNIIGYSIQDIFIAIRNNLVGPGGNGWNIANWESITGAVLSGGALAGAGALALNSAIVATGGGFAAAIYLLLPALAVVILAAVVAVLILAARQAIITILIIISPLAFVAFLLPNTEKLFDKWKDLFTTLLVMFPMFSIVFGGAQLAGTAIIQNADSVVLIILGMLVQVAPVVITPLLIRLSGSLLGKIAGMVNNPKKGVLDRTRNWSKERADLHKARSLATTPKRNAFRASAQRKHVKHVREQQWKKAYEADAEAHAMGDKGYQNASHRLTEAGIGKEKAQAVIDKAFNDMRINNARIQVADVDLRAAKLEVDVSKAKADVQWENLRAAPSPINVDPIHLAQSALIARSATQQSYVEASRLHAATETHKDDFAHALETSPALQHEAGGIDPRGAMKALATANAAITRTSAEMVKNISDASPIASGDINAMDAAFRQAVANDDVESMRAHADMLASSGNPGVERLRAIMTAEEANMTNAVTKGIFKHHVNNSQAINTAAEDIATWSRDSAARPLSAITVDPGTWSEMSPRAFAVMKKSSQLAALSTGAISKATAQAIQKLEIYADLKPSVRTQIDTLAT